MSIYNRPRLEKAQIDQFKSDIKLLGRLIISELNAYKGAKYPPTATQNAFARYLNFDSFSELNYLVVSETHHPDFSLKEAFYPEDIFRIFEKINHRDRNATKLNLNHVLNAIEEFELRNEKPKEPTIKLSSLIELINDSEYCEHKYDSSDVFFPSKFNIDPKDEFFENLSHEDHFVVKSGDENKWYTITEFEHVYSKRKVFQVLRGKWFNLDSSPFCTGD